MKTGQNGKKMLKRKRFPWPTKGSIPRKKKKNHKEGKKKNAAKGSVGGKEDSRQGRTSSNPWGSNTHPYELRETPLIKIKVTNVRGEGGGEEDMVKTKEKRGKLRLSQGEEKIPGKIACRDFLQGGGGKKGRGGRKNF